MSCNSALQLPTGSKALPAPEYVVGGHDIGIACETADPTAEKRLRHTVQGRHIPARGACAARVRRRNGVDLSSELQHLLIEHVEEHPPSLIEDGAVEAALLLHVFAGLLKGSPRRGGHVLDPQVLTIDNRVVFADVGGELVKMIMARVGDLLVELGDFFLLFLPVFAEPHHALKAPLQFGELLLGAAEGIDGKIDLAVREGCGLLYPHIDPNLAARSGMLGRNHLTLSEDRDVPTVRLTLHRDALDLSVEEAAAPITDPPDLREVDLSARLFYLESLRVADRVLVLELLVQARELGTSLKEVDHSRHEVLHALLQHLAVAFAEPGELLLPFRQKGAKLRVAHPEGLILFTLLLVPVERLVVDEARAAAGLCQLAARRPVGLELENISFV